MVKMTKVKYRYHGSPNLWEKEMTPGQKKKHKKAFGDFVKYED